MNRNKAIILLIAVLGLCLPANLFARQTGKKNHYHVDKTWVKEANGTPISHDARVKEAKRDLQRVVCARNGSGFLHKYIIVGVGDKSCTICTQQYFVSWAKQNPGYTMVSSNVFKDFKLLQATNSAGITSSEFVPTVATLTASSEDNSKRAKFCSAAMKSL